MRYQRKKSWNHLEELANREQVRSAAKMIKKIGTSLHKEKVEDRQPGKNITLLYHIEPFLNSSQQAYEIIQRKFFDMESSRSGQVMTKIKQIHE